MVEDEIPVRTFIARALTMQGIKLIEARSGEEALAISKKYKDKIDIIVSDIIIPGMNGPEWVKKSRAYCPNARAIFMSGYTEEIYNEHNQDIKTDAFLQKPFSLHELIRVITTVAQ